MAKQKQGSWSLPTYQSSGVINFSNPYGTSAFTPGSTGKNSGTFGFNLNPQTQDYYNQLASMRSQIYAGLGYNTPQTDTGLQNWQDTFVKEALRTSMPQLEQSYFARGLGGSAAYNQGLADLLSNVNTQGVLNANSLYNQDQALKLNYLASINPQIADIVNQANSLAGSSYGATQNQYQELLPYLATWNQPKSGTPWGTIGSLAGGALGLAAAPFTGGASLAAIPALSGVGGTVGGMFQQGGGNATSGLDLSTLASLSNIFRGGGGGTSNNPSPISPMTLMGSQGAYGNFFGS